MDYEHTVRFVPTGETVQSASETKKVTVTTSEQRPGEDTADEAVAALCHQITPYAARNHWAVHDFLTTPADPPWGSAVSVQRTVKAECNLAERVQTVRKGRERYTLVHTDGGLMSHHLRAALQKLYDDQPLGVLIQPRSATKKCIYFKWETIYDE